MALGLMAATTPALASPALASPALASPALASPAPPSSAGSLAATGGQPAGSGLHVTVDAGYGVVLPRGSWVPVSVVVANKGPAFQGTVVVSVAGPANGQYCVRTGGGVSCSTPPGPLAGAPGHGSEVSYRIPLDLAAGTTKHLGVDVEPVSPPVSVRVLDTAGAEVAMAKGTLPVGFSSGGPVHPVVAVVSDHSSTLDALGAVDLPGRGQVQVAHLSPAQLPGSGALLAGFTAVALDQASTAALTPAQGRALADYVTNGGTLLVAGGVGWKATAAGLPPGLLPVSVSGVAPSPLAGLAAGLGVAAPAQPGQLATARPRPGATVVSSQGSTPVVVQRGQGRGRVLFTAFDPAVPPFTAWPGTTALLRQLLAGARGPSGGQVVSAGPSFLMAGRPSSLAADGVALAPVLADMPGVTLPSAAVLAILLLAYLVVVGPLNFFVLKRLGRRDLAWATVPAISLVAVAAAWATGLGTPRSPVVNQVRLAVASPGSHRAAVASLAAVYLPRGGSVAVRPAGGALLTGLAGTGGRRAQLVVDGPGASRSVTLSGATGTLTGFSSYRHGLLSGQVAADLTRQGTTLSGTVTNHLRVGLSHVAVISPSGTEKVLGHLAPGASMPVKVSLGHGTGAPVPPAGFAVPLS
ncbi:MAG: hypothetical protein ACRD0J_00035, partial [Acidimicrobiales bacterium]